jgi:alginate O-acetyltransferase complex protein AlgI
MSFTSIVFLLFLLGLSVVYFLMPKKYQWVVLLVGSYVFYLSAGVELVFYILFSTLTAFFGARLLERLADSYKLASADALGAADKKALKATSTRRRKAVIALVLVLNFSILVFFKHFNAFAGYVNALLGLVQVDAQMPQLNLLLPLGISFYTFQSMGYLIDVYRTKFKADRNVAKFALFVSFFPQLIQGPISRYDDLAHQLYEGHKFDFDRMKKGAVLMLWGLFKKLVIGDRIAILVNTIFDKPSTYTGAYVLLGVVLYSIQIYADFSGGVDIARGAAQILGIDLADNFERPYFATTIPDFWRRWHATLNNWWRDYVFYPLTFSKGFSKFGKSCRKLFSAKWGKLIPVYTATMLVRVINALWHGASFKFIAFGLYHGALIILGMQLEPFFLKLANKLKINTECFSWKLFRILRTFALVCVGRIFLRADSFSGSLTLIKNTFTMFDAGHSRGLGILFDGSLLELGLTGNALFVLFLAVAVLFLVDLSNEKGLQLRDRLLQQNMLFQWIVLIALIVSVAVFGVYGPQYSATSFIYQQF